jgi:hypothetical protein
LRQARFLNELRHRELTMAAAAATSGRGTRSEENPELVAE